MTELSKEEIRKRLQRLNNFEKIKHPRVVENNEKLREENTKLRLENATKNKIIEKLRLELEEVQAMKFGKKRSNPKQKANKLPSGKTNKSNKLKAGSKERGPESYRRPEPKEEEITGELRLEVEVCPECGEKLKNKQEHVHYREDLKNAQEAVLAAKEVVKTIIEGGICKNKDCELFGKKIFGGTIPKQKVIIGESLRRMVVFLSVAQGQSYSEVEKSLEQLYGYKLSSGQIINILEGESVLLTPYYNYLIKTLDEKSRNGGAHYDETSHKTQSQGDKISEGNFCWVKIAVETQHQLIWFGRGRGKQVAEDLRGDKEGSIGITDDYPGYKNTFEHHQLCWAHPHRKLRDLAESGKLEGRAQKICKKAFKDFQSLYKKARKVREKLLKGSWNKEQKQEEYKKLEKLFDAITIKTDSDPEKLSRLRATLMERKPRYFTFLDHPKLPLDNNKAERAIRKVVIRRKKSLGCKSPKAADILSILYSVIFSITENNPDKNFFDLYDFVANFEDSNI